MPITDGVNGGVAGTKRKRKDAGIDSPPRGETPEHNHTELPSNDLLDGEPEDMDNEDFDFIVDAHVAEEDGAPRKGRRGRKRRQLDFLGPYKPGFPLNHPDIFNAALKIAAQLNAHFVDDAETAKLRASEATYTRSQSALKEAEAALQQNQNPDQQVPLQTRVDLLKQQVEQHENAYNTAQLEYRKLLRRNMQDKVQRVTLFKDVSDAAERGASSNALDFAVAMTPEFVCRGCGNADETMFVNDMKAGDVTCKVCGIVAMEHAVHDGDWTRHFEGEEDNSQLGPAPIPFVSARHNLRTTIAAAPGVRSGDVQKLRLAQQSSEMNQGGVSDVMEHATRDAYRDKQKIKAFDRLKAAGERLCLSEPTIEKAKALFAAFRDNREHVQSFDQMVAACLIAAVEEAEYEKRKEEVAIRLAQQAAATAATDSANGSTAADQHAGDGEIKIKIEKTDTSAPSATEASKQAVPATAVATTTTSTAAAKPSSSAQAASTVAALLHSKKPAAPPNPEIAKREQQRRAQSSKKSKALGYTGQNFMDMEDEDDDNEEEDCTKRIKTYERLEWIGDGSGLSTEQINTFLKTLEGSEELNPEIAMRDEYRAPS